MRRSLATVIGPVTLVEEGGAIVALSWNDEGAGDDSPALLQAEAELKAYFDGHLTRFKVPMAPRATAFQARFYQALMDIPYGETRRYGDLAEDLGVSAQAIGQACGANPLPILIPCHRVLAASGLGGYSGRDGVETKISLLKLEGAASLLI